jgi:hypothetical protein
VARVIGLIHVDGMGLHLVTMVVTKVSNCLFTYMLSCIFTGGIIGFTNELSCILHTINCFLTHYLSHICRE